MFFFFFFSVTGKKSNYVSHSPEMFPLVGRRAQKTHNKHPPAAAPASLSQAPQSEAVQKATSSESCCLALRAGRRIEAQDHAAPLVYLQVEEELWLSTSTHVRSVPHPSHPVPSRSAGTPEVKLPAAPVQVTRPTWEDGNCNGTWENASWHSTVTGVFFPKPASATTKNNILSCPGKLGKTSTKAGLNIPSGI